MTRDENKGFERGVMCGLLVSLAAQGGHWLITPIAHPDASTARYVGVWMQIIICAAGAAYLARVARKSLQTVTH
jgi:hypothetical protein